MPYKRHCSHPAFFSHPQQQDRILLPDSPDCKEKPLGMISLSLQVRAGSSDCTPPLWTSQQWVSPAAPGICPSQHSRGQGSDSHSRKLWQLQDLPLVPNSSSWASSARREKSFILNVWIVYCNTDLMHSHWCKAINTWKFSKGWNEAHTFLHGLLGRVILLCTSPP